MLTLVVNSTWACGRFSTFLRCYALKDKQSLVSITRSPAGSAHTYLELSVKGYVTSKLQHSTGAHLSTWLEVLHLCHLFLLQKVEVFVLGDYLQWKGGRLDLQHLDDVLLIQRSLGSYSIIVTKSVSNQFKLKRRNSHPVPVWCTHDALLKSFIATCLVWSSFYVIIVLKL